MSNQQWNQLFNPRAPGSSFPAAPQAQQAQGTGGFDDIVHQLEYSFIDIPELLPLSDEEDDEVVKQERQRQLASRRAALAAAQQGVASAGVIQGAGFDAAPYQQFLTQQAAAQQAAAAQQVPPGRAVAAGAIMGDGGGSTQQLERAIALAEAGEAAAAVPLFQDAAERSPGSAAVHEMLAQACMEAGLDEDAWSAAQAAAALAPSWPDVQLTLGRAARNSGRLGHAAAALRAYVAARPDDAEAEAELEEVAALQQEAIGRQVGLPGLRLEQRQGGGVGPGSAVWESGALLAWFVIHGAGRCPASQTEGLVGQPQHARATTCCQGTARVPGSAAAGAAGSAWRGARVLELGAGGSGIAGLAAACLGAHVVATDLPAVLPQLEGNLQRNRGMVGAAGGSIAAAALDWRDPPEQALSRLAAQLEGQLEGRQRQHLATPLAFDWLIGADLIYSEAAIPPLVATIRAVAAAAVGRSQLPLLVAHKHRHDEVDSQLLEQLQAAGLGVRVLLRDPGSRCTVFGSAAAAAVLAAGRGGGE
eukprot:scaffold13.g260.t1